MTNRLATYRVYFTAAPQTYYAVSARNARHAVWQAKRLRNALRHTRRRSTRLVVDKIERLDKTRIRQLKVKR
jgi:hypothetical protein